MSESSGGSLHVVATPIGNLADITLRAVETLRAADVILAEDTRRSRTLLSHLGITGKPLRCFDAHATTQHVEAALLELAEGRTLALLTDAGTPAVSDPGSQLVRRCHEQGIRVVPIPGPSAVTAAISASGFADAGFWFLGFLPRKGAKRTHAIHRIVSTPEAVVLFEAPGRSAATLQELAEHMPKRRVLIARELTKKFEELRLMSLTDAAAHAETFRGEVTLVVEPDENAGAPGGHNADELDARILDALRRGNPAKEISEALSDPPRLSRRDVYRRVLELRAEVESLSPELSG